MEQMKVVHVRLAALCAFMFLWAWVTEAEIYRWVDKDGMIHFADTVPGGAVTGLKNVSADTLPQFVPAKESAVSTQEVVSEDTQVRKKTSYSVELYTTAWCGYCKKARNFFKERSIPFKEYDIEKDRAAAMRKRKLHPAQV